MGKADHHWSPRSRWSVQSNWFLSPFSRSLDDDFRPSWRKRDDHSHRQRLQRRRSCNGEFSWNSKCFDLFTEFIFRECTTTTKASSTSPTRPSSTPWTASIHSTWAPRTRSSRNTTAASRTFSKNCTIPPTKLISRRTDCGMNTAWSTVRSEIWANLMNTNQYFSIFSDMVAYW